jgi:hypothetical protein
MAERWRRRLAEKRRRHVDRIRPGHVGQVLTDPGTVSRIGEELGRPGKGAAHGPDQVKIAVKPRLSRRARDEHGG